MTEEQHHHELFDTRLRAALMEPPSYDRLRSHAERRHTPGTRIVMSVTVAAAAVICALVAFAAQTSESKLDSEPPSPVKHDPEPAQDKRTRSDKPILDRIRNDSTRAACLAEIMSQGKDGATKLAAALGKLDAARELTALRESAQALGQMGPDGATVAPALLKAAAHWPPEACLQALRALADLAPFHREKPDFGRIAADSVEFKGRRLTTTTEARPGDFLSVRNRWRVRAKVQLGTPTANLATLLGSKSALERDAALDVLTFRHGVDRKVRGSLEAILMNEQPELSEYHWITDPRPAVRPFRSSSHPLLRPKASQLLLRLGKGDPERITALAWTLTNPEKPQQERAVAAHLLGSTQWTGEKRIDFAIRSLMAAASGADLVIARSATSSIGMHGRKALLAFSLLEKLQQHADATMRQQATASLSAIRKTLLGN